MHTSISFGSPIELIDMTPMRSNPLISKCKIKVCYVGNEPNRNNSIITKDVAKQMALSLPGSPIVGFYNETKQDFEGHERELVLEDDKLYFKDITRPYGFVDLNAQPWFEKFLDDGIEHEYLMTEGYLWTGQYSEAQRIIDEGNNQSMELDPKLTKGYWTNLNNDGPELFIINEAVVSKLCILGKDVEPCFEGADITKYQLSFDDGFKNQLFEFINEIKQMLEKGEVSMDQNEDKVVESTVTEDTTTTDTPVTYNLEDIKEYVELNQRYSALEADNNSLNENIKTLNTTIESLNSELEELRTYKLGIERVEKENMIASFYMLSDEDKADVVAKIDELSVSDIEKELSVICFRNKVSFNTEDSQTTPTTYSLNSTEDDDDAVPAWIKAVRSVAKEMN
ncbi:MAG: hypothetical protein PUG89_02110 [Succinivibrio sp.]|nr:hypothetical protein [Succinivibrio sp.]